jgi:hypothetical protein
MNPLAPVTRQSLIARVDGRAAGSLPSARRGGWNLSRRRSVAVAMSRTTRPVLAAELPWHSASTASSASRKLRASLLGQRQRRQQLDHVVLAGRHRDHAVVAMQRDHDQLREQPLAGHVDQAPVQPATRPLGAPSSIPIISPLARISLIIS